MKNRDIDLQLIFEQGNKVGQQYLKFSTKVLVLLNLRNFLLLLSKKLTVIKKFLLKKLITK